MRSAITPFVPAGFMQERLGVPADEVPELKAELFANYGTTLAGLVVR